VFRTLTGSENVVAAAVDPVGLGAKLDGRKLPVEKFWTELTVFESVY
jgi:hypothetical protein